MTNTINNVPRELLADLLGNDHDKRIMAERHLLAMLANAPLPTGVDGLEVVGWYRMDDRKAITPYPSVCATWHKMGVKVGAAYSDSAHAIIDGLRGEIEVMTQHANNYSRMFEECAEERDHLAQCLKFVRTTMAVVANNANLRGVEYRSLVTEVKRIDAALAAVCAAAPNITPTSEHSSQPERDPCPMCIKGGICNTPTCGRLRAMPKAY